MKSQNHEPQKMHLRLAFDVVVEKDGNTFHAFSPELKGLHVDGKTEEEAFRNAIEAASCYLSSVVRHGDPLPIGRI
jgi:predicted RNase H-like HicB family nuclease